MDLIEKINSRELKLAVIGLGYVGLPLAVEFGKVFDTVGFDVKHSRLEMLRQGNDNTLEISPEELASAVRLTYSGDIGDLRDRDIFIVTVPTPVDKYNQPDLSPLKLASDTVGKVMKKGAVAIFESTVYPGCTEEICVPVMERESGMTFNKDFFCGYSPERINPGDKEHTFTRIKKIVSGSTPEILEVVDALYNSVLEAGTFRAGSIKVAEAAKVIENSQRDLNVAFVNELAKIFHLVGIDTAEVLEAAGTKWNFLKFRPGLVGGHCIGVDPYYLTYKAQELGYLPEVILAGRRINDSMGQYVAQEVVKLMIKSDFKVLNARVLQLGVTFKENCPDIRNSRAVDVTRTLQEFGCQVDILDPMADPQEVKDIYGLNSSRTLPENARYDAIVLAVAHRQFENLDLEALKNPGAVIFDIKSILPREMVDGRL
ncbi:MAG: nucleotide sugar dehydrogenase [Lentisphaerae bacterium]|nr:nucleotide sugar dehydrogenase [Lentisphaerota bacterium]